MRQSKNSLRSLRLYEKNSKIAVAKALRLTNEGSIDLLVPWLLMCAYAYYELDFPMVPDYVYDEWYQRLKRGRRRVKHPHLHLIDTTGRGSSGAILLRKDTYPSMVKGAVRDWMNRYVF